MASGEMGGAQGPGLDLVMRGGIAGLLGSLADTALHHLGLLAFRTSTTAMYIAQIIFPGRRSRA